MVIIISAVYWTKADEGLTVATAFTSMALIGIVSGPVMLIIVSFMQLATALGCFTRLQTFLLQEERVDRREVIGASSKSSLIAPSTAQPEEVGDDVELTRFQPRQQTSTLETIDRNQMVVHLRDASFKVGDNTQILHDLNIKVQQGSLNMFVGRVGCGKSSLLKAIIGELPLSGGSITVHAPSMAYCDQVPWLQNVSIRDNIIGQTALDEQWLATVLRSVTLDEDVARLELGDRSIVGTGGVALSGGQKQRVVSEAHLPQACHCVLISLDRLLPVPSMLGSD